MGPNDAGIYGLYRQQPPTFSSSIRWVGRGQTRGKQAGGAKGLSARVRTHQRRNQEPTGLSDR